MNTCKVCKLKLSGAKGYYLFGIPFIGQLKEQLLQIQGHTHNINLTPMQQCEIYFNYSKSLLYT